MLGVVLCDDDLQLPLVSDIEALLAGFCCLCCVPHVGVVPYNGWRDDGLQLPLVGDPASSVQSLVC
jgi:hypothetical protein